MAFVLGTNKFASQKGMAIGASRQISDKNADKMAVESQHLLHAQSGTCAVAMLHALYTLLQLQCCILHAIYTICCVS